MEDRELLEFAAKAAGIKGHYVEDDDWYGTGILFTDEDDCNKIINPLIDDGDTLRLAVKLGAGGHFSDLIFGKLSVIIDGDGNGIFVRENVSDEIDIHAATRLAIVRAAAEIGKAMK